jgi:hypothetical protein
MGEGCLHPERLKVISKHCLFLTENISLHPERLKVISKHCLFLTGNITQVLTSRTNLQKLEFSGVRR